MAWHNQEQIQPLKYTCGYCGSLVSSNRGYYTSKAPQQFIYLCPHCGNPSHFPGKGQIPGVAPGAHVQHLPPDVDALFSEARQCVAANAHTASVLISRKLLMNIAVAQGAKAGEPFIAYVEYLSNAGFVPPNGKHWVDHIRKKGNEATHEIKLMSDVEAAELLAFLEMLLKFIYEFPAKIPAGSP